MAYKRKPRKLLKRKPRRRMPKTAKSMTSAVKKILQGELEKKRFTICPQSNARVTVGDVITHAAIDATIFGGNGTVATLSANPVGPFAVSQSYNTTTVANTGGWAIFDITPIPDQTNATDGRVGSSITLSSSFIKFQLQQQSANVVWASRVKVLIVENTGPSIPSINCMTDMFQNNPFTYSSANTSGFIDFNSSRQPDNFKNFRIIRQMTCKVPIDPYYASGASGALQVKDFTMKLKFNRGKGHRVRYLQNNTANSYLNVTAGQLFMLFLSDVGQISTTTLVTSPNSSLIGNQVASCGTNVNFHLTHYYTDS